MTAGDHDSSARAARWQRFRATPPRLPTAKTPTTHSPEPNTTVHPRAGDVSADDSVEMNTLALGPARRSARVRTSDLPGATGGG
jgi:hypothetical protein